MQTTRTPLSPQMENGWPSRRRRPLACTSGCAVFRTAVNFPWQVETATVPGQLGGQTLIPLSLPAIVDEPMVCRRFIAYRSRISSGQIEKGVSKWSKQRKLFAGNSYRGISSSARWLFHTLSQLLVSFDSLPASLRAQQSPTWVEYHLSPKFSAGGRHAS